MNSRILHAITVLSLLSISNCQETTFYSVRDRSSIMSRPNLYTNKSVRTMLSQGSQNSKSSRSIEDNAFVSAFDAALADDNAVNVEEEEIYESIERHDAAAAGMSSLDRRRFGLPVVDSNSIASDSSSRRGSVGSTGSMRDKLMKMTSSLQLSQRKLNDVDTTQKSPQFNMQKSSRSLNTGLNNDRPSLAENRMKSNRPFNVAASERRLGSPDKVPSHRQPIRGKSQASLSSRPTMYKQESAYTSSSYEIPMPILPFESRRGTIVRVMMGIIFFALSLTFTLLGAGDGKIGMSISSYLYSNFIVDGETSSMATDTPEQIFTSNGAHLFETLRELETSYRANAVGIPEYHIPKIIMNDLEVEIEIGLKPHTMSKDHFIKYIWLRDVNAKTIVLAKEFKHSDASPPVLRAKVPAGVTLQPHLFCTKHDLWIGDQFHVDSIN